MNKNSSGEIMMKNRKLHILDDAQAQTRKVNLATAIEELVREGCSLKEAKELAPVALKIYSLLLPMSHRAQGRTMAYIQDWASDPDTQTTSD